MQGTLTIISAPSGTGKTTVIHRFLAKHPNMIHSVSCTTRPMRGGETDGKDYHFISREDFEKGIKNGMFAEWCPVHENFYGTPKAQLDKWLAEGKDVLLDLDVVGALKLKKTYPVVAMAVFLAPPSTKELERRLLSRGTDSKEQQQIRLRNAMEEMTYREKFDVCVVNDVLDRACDEIESLIQTHKKAVAAK